MSRKARRFNRQFYDKNEHYETRKQGRREKHRSNHNDNNEQINNRQRLYAKTLSQEKLINSVYQNHITFSIGVAGTGKSCCAAGLAIQYLLDGKVDKIIISRPLVYAGEDPGALPGGINEKLYPFLIPLYDELLQFSSYSEIAQWKNSNTIEVVPLAFTRGRTFKNAFIILDEAQNATYEQIKMFITRFGENSKMLINGDYTQSDLKLTSQGGLSIFAEKLKNLNGIGIIKLEDSHVVRHPLIPEILEALDK